MLRNGTARPCLLAAAAALADLPLAAAPRRGLAHLPRDEVLAEPVLERLLAEHVPRLSRADRPRVTETLVLAADRAAAEERGGRRWSATTGPSSWG